MQKVVDGDQDSEIEQIPAQWADMTLYVIRHAYFNSPTYSSRSLGYLGLTMYETVVNSDTSKRSMNGQLNGLGNIPVPESNVEYHWPLALNAGQATLLTLLYPYPKNISTIILAKIDSLSKFIYDQNSRGIAQATIDRSVEFGKKVAEAIYDWAQNDGGHNGFLRHFDPSFVFPVGAGYWVPPLRGQVITNFPLHPHWGKNRTFVKANSLLPVPPMIPYSKDINSENYKIYNAVYLKNIKLTQEEMEIAAWWADDPTETFSPPGHSYNLATIAIKKDKATIVKAAETYARVGMAVGDAFINCWKAKFTYFNERPSTFVKSNINATWLSYWPEPPFPAFPSGHATQSSAAATVMTDIFGEDFSLIDNSHEGASRFSPTLTFKRRSFKSLWATAVECGYSRFLGGIHTQQDNDTGLAEGRKIGQNINNLIWDK